MLCTQKERVRTRSNQSRIERVYSIGCHDDLHQNCKRSRTGRGLESSAHLDITAVVKAIQPRQELEHSALDFLFATTRGVVPDSKGRKSEDGSKGR